MSEKIIITTMNQKSMGKSTIAMALGGRFKFIKKLRVLIIDADDEQLSAWNKAKRDRDVWLDGERDEEQIEVTAISIRNELFFRDQLDKYWEDYDVFIIDTAGSLIDAGAKKMIAEWSDLILVPMSARELDVHSYMLFINSIKESVGEDTEVRIVRNYYDARNKDWIEHDKEFQGEYAGFKYLEATIPERRKYARYPFTLMPLTDHTWNVFYNEIETILDKKGLWQNDRTSEKTPKPRA